jgi:predicted O-methyltransferase YrrM
MSKSRKAMKVIQLDVFLQEYLDISGPSGNPDNSASQEATHKAYRSRSREVFMRKYLLPQLVRRLDAGFARSTTVHPDTARALYNICYASNVRNVFETGTYWGFSTTYLAAALQRKGGGTVYSFDIYDKAGKHIPESLMPHVEMHRGKPSIETMPNVLSRVTPDLFFQDSRHDYEGVVQELEIVAPHLRPGAIVLFHDFVEPQVRQAASDVLKGYDICILDNSDPQQLGVAVNLELAPIGE